MGKRIEADNHGKLIKPTPILPKVWVAKVVNKKLLNSRKKLILIRVYKLSVFFHPLEQ